MLRNQSPIFVPKLLPVDIVTIEEEPLLLRYGLRVSFNERDEINLKSRLRWIKECNLRQRLLARQKRYQRCNE